MLVSLPTVKHGLFQIVSHNNEKKKTAFLVKAFQLSQSAMKDKKF